MKRQMMRGLVMTTALLAAGGLAAPSHSAQQRPVAAFRGGVTLVTVDVTALDRNGRPVSGLSADDFRITLDGKAQPIRTLSYIDTSAPNGNGAAVPAAETAARGRVVVTNTLPADDARILILAIDDMSFSAADGRRLLAAARTFVERQSANVLVGLTTTSGAVAVNPTYDRAAIAGALREVVGSFIDPRKLSGTEAPTISIVEALEIAAHSNTSVLSAAIRRECAGGGRPSETNLGIGSNAIGNYNSKCASDVMASARTIASLSQGNARQQTVALANVLDALQGAPGLKQMIVLTQGIAGTRDLDSLFERVVTAAASAGVRLSVLMEDEDDLDLSSQDRLSNAFGQSVGGTGTAARRREDRRMFMLALHTLADMSGGTFERVITNTDGAFRRAALAGSAIYRLGVEASPDADLSRSFDVGASVTRDGVTLRVNRRTVAARRDAETKPADRVAAAMKNGAAYYRVPMHMGIARRRAEGDRVELELDVDVPASVAGPLRVTVGVLDSRGVLRQGTQTLPAPAPGTGYRHTVAMKVESGAYRIRVAAEDANGNIGSLNAQVEARLNRMGPFEASDLLTWHKDESGPRRMLALEEMPQDLAALSAGVELYPVAGEHLPTDLTVRLGIFAAGASTPIAEIDLRPASAGDVRRAEAALPVANLPAGPYLIRAVVLGNGQRLGTVSTTINILAR